MNFGLYYPPFHLDKDAPSTTGPRWMEWINGFDLMLNNCSVAEADKLALLMRFVGRGVREICTSLKLDEKAREDDRFTFTKRALAEHFRKLSSSNITFQRYLFSWLRQRDEESFESFSLRVKETAAACDFKADYDRCVRDQIVFGCRSDDIRRQAFLHDYELEDLLLVGRDWQDEGDTGLLTSGGDVISVFLPDSAVSLFRVSLTTSEAPSQSDSNPQQQQNPQPTTKSHTANGASEVKPIIHRVIGTVGTQNPPPIGPSAPQATGRRRNGGPSNDPLLQFDDLSLANYPDATATMTREELRKERAKERRRRQRKETFVAIKTKPFDELTEKQRKFLEYQQKLKEKWSKRRAEGKKSGGGGGGGGGAATAAGGSSGVAASSEGNDDGDDGIKFASDDDDDDDFAGRHLDGSPPGKEGRREFNGKFRVIDSPS